MVGQQTPGGVDNANGLFIESAAGLSRLKAAGGRASQRPYHLPHRGPAPMAFPADTETLAAVYRFCLERGVRPLILGAGSNVLAPDGGLNRLVVCTRELTGLTVQGTLLTAECGVLLSRLASFARDQGLTGLSLPTASRAPSAAGSI